jgi:hypothetical protein
MENNYMALVEQLRNDNNNNMRILDLKIGELNNQFPEIKDQLKEIKIKIKNVETIQNINTTTTNHINTTLRDSVINDSIKVKVATYNDEWIKFSLININDSISTNITTRDSLFIVLHKDPRNLFQFLRGEPKNVRSTIKNYNPNSTITYNRLIKIEK